MHAELLQLRACISLWKVSVKHDVICHSQAQEGPHCVDMSKHGAEELVRGGCNGGVRVQQVQQRQGAGALQHRALRSACIANMQSRNG